MIVLKYSINKIMKYTFLLLLLFTANAFSSDLCEPHPELEFLNGISGVLEIELSEKAQPMEKLPGVFLSDSNAKIVATNLNAEYYNEQNDSFRPLTHSELNSVAFKAKKITLGSESGETIDHLAGNMKYFTVQEILKAVEVTELKTRGNTDWFGGIDVHHIYFEGLSCHQGVWIPFWGS